LSVHIYEDDVAVFTHTDPTTYPLAESLVVVGFVVAWYLDIFSIFI
jgi:hypothetical protein